MKNTDVLRLERLREVLHYDPESGGFTWRVQAATRRPAGSAAGCVRKNGYVKIGIDGVLYYAHRLAWFYVHGEWPVATIDHVNGVRNDNAIANLRAASAQVNSQNRRQPHSNNRLKMLGVCQKGNRYQAQLQVGARFIYLGMFQTASEAHEAYLQAKRQHHEGCTL